MSGITTHVLDASRGTPAAGAPVRLEIRLPGGGWELVTETRTDGDGRASLAGAVAQGVYRITFDTEAYMPGGLYPEVAITFHVRDLSRGYHVPLLLGPYGYTTYRGS